MQLLLYSCAAAPGVNCHAPFVNKVLKNVRRLKATCSFNTRFVNETLKHMICFVHFTTPPSCTVALLRYFQTPYLDKACSSHPPGLHFAVVSINLYVINVQCANSDMEGV